MGRDQFLFNNGDKVRDQISGFMGIVTTRADHLYGCARYWVMPQEIKDGKSADGQWYDEGALELVAAGVIAPKTSRVAIATGEKTGAITQPASSTGPAGR